MTLLDHFRATQLLAFPQRNKIPLEYMIVEVIFSEMFQMPSSRYPDIAYGSTLIELCKLQPGTMPQVRITCKLILQWLGIQSLSIFSDVCSNFWSF